MLESQRGLFDIPRDVAYFNAAAWSPIPIGAVEVGKAGASRKSRPWEVPHGFDETQFERSRKAAAGLINASPDDVALISSVGYGVCTAAKVFDVPKGSRVLVLDNDHSSPVLEWMVRAGDGSFEVAIVSTVATHDWTTALVEEIVRTDCAPVALASISSVHWSDGGLVDLDRVQAALKAHGAGLLIDATHAAGVMAIDVTQLDPDFVIFPTYKWLLGPYGRAFIYVARRHQGGVPLEQTGYGRKGISGEAERYFSDLEYVDNARRFDMGERDFFVSLAVAAHSIELVQSWGANAVQDRLGMLTRRIANGLVERGTAVTMLAEKYRAPHVLSLGFLSGMPDNLIATLATHKVYAASRLGRLRISPHVYNDESDCDRLLDVLDTTVRQAPS
ncbi:MAG: aminotransferase class V-fold PLP-dependent enzyme [Hyphomicrobiaceae bacterium]